MKGGVRWSDSGAVCSRKETHSRTRPLSSAPCTGTEADEGTVTLGPLIVPFAHALSRTTRPRRAENLRWSRACAACRFLRRSPSRCLPLSSADFQPPS
jgi:hypothetical protein